MAYKDINKQRKFQRERNALVRKQWLDENGPCKNCGAEENLEVHHVDKDQKESHNVWSWAEERRLKELSKCIVLCKSCHILTHFPFEHGNRGYDRKCRCDICKEAHRIRCKIYREKLVYVV